MHQAGALAPRVGFAKVYINNSYWGLYLVVEQIDKTFLDSHLKEKSGNLYKSSGDLGVSPCFLTGHEDGFELKTNKDLNDKSGLSAMFSGLSAATTADNCSQYFNLTNVISYYAAAALCGHWDSFTHGQNNDYLYQHSDGKFRIITWDVDNTFGSEWIGTITASNPTILNTSIYQMRDNDNYQALFKKILDDSEWRTRYQAKIRTLLDTIFNTEHLYAKIDAWKSTIRSAVLSDPRKHWDWGITSLSAGNEWWEQGFDRKPDGWLGSGFNNDGLGLKPWIAGRIAAVRAELDSTAPVDSDGNTSFDTAQSISADTPASGGITADVDSDYFALTISSSGFYQISLENLTGDFTLELYNSGQTLMTSSSNSGTTNETFGLILSPGTYYLKVSPVSGQTGSYTVNYGSVNSIQVSVALGSGFEDKSGTYGYWTMPTGTNCTVTATASDTNSSISHVEFYLSSYLWATVSNAPYQLSLSFADGSFFTFSVTAKAYNSLGQSKTSSASPDIRVYTSAYQDPQDNGDGTFTFRVNPLHIPGGSADTPVYLAGSMNGWGSTTYATANQLTNRGDGILCLTYAAASGDQYKFNADFNNDGMRSNDEWWVSPANPYMDPGNNYNNIIP